jgi:integrase
MTAIAFHDELAPRSVFAGADICREAGLTLADGAARPVFEDEVWEFGEVVGLPVHMPPVARRLDFAPIADPRWRLVAKELMMAMLTPRHDAVVALPRAMRTALHLRTCGARLSEAVRFFGWLEQRGTISLSMIGTADCEAYLAHRRYVLDERGAVVGEQSPGTRRAAAQVVVDLVNYRDLFTADRVRADLRPWGGASASAIAEMPNGREGNTTEPVPDTLLQPVLAAALYLVSALGPHAVGLDRQLRAAERTAFLDAAREHSGGYGALEAITRVLRDYERTGQALPMLESRDIAKRLAAGWAPDDPLLTVATSVVARRAGYRHFLPKWLPELRTALQKTAAAVGIEKQFARHAPHIAPAGEGDLLAWTEPLDRLQAVALVGIVRTATIITVGAVTGMRASELMELRIGARRPVEEPVPGLHRYRIASKVVKGQPLGGTEDEWVVIEPVHRAIELAEQLHATGDDGDLLFGRIAFAVRYQWFRNWVNSVAGQRLGLAPIPGGQLNLRMLRRTLALELAYRPGGVLATKIHLKHVAVATTEGYASRSGGAQAELLTEVNKYEADRNLELLLTEFRNYQQGIRPAGPGARSLTEFFASIDPGPVEPDTAAPRTQHSDRDILNLLTKRAKTLHLGSANYCWFTDPSRALCLKIAGTPTADKPLVGMCDSAHCPQATHHPCHRPVWAEHAQQTKTFLGQLGKTRATERSRLRADYDRALRVIAEIDAATTTAPE